MEKSKSFMLKINLMFLFAICVADIFYITIGGLVVKSIASALFVLLGLFNVVYLFNSKPENKKFPAILLVGLFFAFLGDVFLEIHFITGAGLFAVGHIFFFASYCTLVPFKVKDLLYALIIFVPSLLIITLVPLFDFGGLLMELVCVFYALIISLMLGKAINNYVSNNSKLSLIILLGSALFFFSDFMLLFNVFANISRAFGVLCLVSYYPAEFLLAFSIFKSKE